jgi:hypothetical protein
VPVDIGIHRLPLALLYLWTSADVAAVVVDAEGVSVAGVLLITLVDVFTSVVRLLPQSQRVSGVNGVSAAPMPHLP